MLATKSRAEQELIVAAASVAQGPWLWDGCGRIGFAVAVTHGDRARHEEDGDADAAGDDAPASRAVVALPIPTRVHVEVRRVVIARGWEGRRRRRWQPWRMWRRRG